MKIRFRAFRHSVAWLACVAALAVPAARAAAQDGPAVPEAEESDVATLPPPSPHWVMVSPPFTAGAARIFDGDSGRMLGSLHLSSLAVAQFDPLGRYIYVAESIWSKGNRGTRQDMITVYDAHTLKLVTEIALPGRLLTGEHRYLMDISADGKRAYVYTMIPSSEIIVVDLVRRKVERTVEIGGCGLAYAAGADKVAALCGDGTYTTVDLAQGTPKVTQSAPFFKPDDDPVFDNSIVDARTGKAVFLSYSGLIYQTTVGSGAPVGEGWSIQEAAGMPRVTSDPLKVNWLPGGRQLMAYDPAAERLYVLMHMGEYWTMKENGTELWTVDLARHKVVRRTRLDKPVRGLRISPDSKPQLYLLADGNLDVVDVATMKTVQTVEDIGYGLLAGPAR